MLNPKPKGLAAIGAFILLAFLAGLVIKWVRTGAGLVVGRRCPQIADDLWIATLIYPRKSFPMTRRICSGVALILIALVSAKSLAEERTSGDWKFRVNEAGEGEIISYSGNASNLVIPAEIEGVAIRHIRDSVFFENKALTSVVFPDGLKTVDALAFYRCDNLSAVQLGKSLEVIGRGAFRGCFNLERVEFPETLTTIEGAAFNMMGTKSKLTGIDIPPGVRTIGTLAFMRCSEITSVIIPKGVTVIEDFTFSGCKSLTNLVIPDGVTAIGYSAFAGCSSLTSLVLPDSVTNIGDNAFAGGGPAVIDALRKRFGNDLARIAGLDEPPAPATGGSVPAGLSLSVGGTNYQNVILKTEYPQSLLIKHNDGATFVNRRDLNQEQLAALLQTKQ